MKIHKTFAYLRKGKSEEHFYKQNIVYNKFVAKFQKLIQLLTNMK